MEIEDLLKDLVSVNDKKADILKNQVYNFLSKYTQEGIYAGYRFYYIKGNFRKYAENIFNKTSGFSKVNYIIE